MPPVFNLAFWIECLTSNDPAIRITELDCSLPIHLSKLLLQLQFAPGPASTAAGLGRESRGHPAALRVEGDIHRAFAGFRAGGVDFAAEELRVDRGKRRHPRVVRHLVPVADQVAEELCALSALMEMPP